MSAWFAPLKHTHSVKYTLHLSPSKIIIIKKTLNKKLTTLRACQGPTAKKLEEEKKDKRREGICLGQTCADTQSGT